MPYFQPIQAVVPTTELPNGSIYRIYRSYLFPERHPSPYTGTQVESEGLRGAPEGGGLQAWADRHSRKNKIQKGKYEGIRGNWDHKRNMVYGVVSNGSWMYHEVLLTIRLCAIQPISWTASSKIWCFFWLTSNAVQLTKCDNFSAKHIVAISLWLTDMGPVESNKEKMDYHTGFNGLEGFSLQKHQSNSSHKGSKDGAIHNIQWWCHLFIVRG